MPWRYQICIVKFLCSYTDDLPEIVFKTLPKNAKWPLPVGVRVLILLADFSPPDVRPNSRKMFFQKYRTPNNGV